MDFSLSGLVEQRIGNWEVVSFNVTELEAYKYNLDVRTSRQIKAGNYKSLRRIYVIDGHESSSIVMSNTPAEINDHLTFINLATGRVLVFGLGLGMVVAALLQKQDVIHITVVELEQDVIDLVGSYYQSISDKVTIIRADAFAYDDEQSYDFVWFDIWDNITSDNLSEMEMLKKRWSYRSGVCMCWCEDDCIEHLRAEKLLDVVV